MSVTTTPDLIVGQLYWVRPTHTLPTAHRGEDRVLAVYTDHTPEEWIALWDNTPTGSQHEQGWLVHRHLSNWQIERWNLDGHRNKRAWWIGGEAIERYVPDDTDTLRTELAAARAETVLAVKALEDFKKTVIEIGGQYAEENEWCSVYEQCMEDLGLQAAMEHEFTVEVTLRATVKTYARTRAIAEERLREAELILVDRPITLSHDYSIEVNRDLVDQTFTIV